MRPPPEGSPKIQERQKLKYEVQRPRAWLRYARSLPCRLRHMDMDHAPAAYKDMFNSYLKGSLERELDDLVRRHGFGKLPMEATWSRRPSEFRRNE